MVRDPVLNHWEKACSHLEVAEPRLAPLFQLYSTERLTGSGDGFQTLANAIVGQQISVKAAESIWKRLLQLLGEIKPQVILDVSDMELRKAGLSIRKVEYLQGLAQAFLTGEIQPELWPSQDDHTVMNSLIKLKGIGPWTAQMFLIFHLHRPDILPLDDIGLLKAAARLYGKEGKMLPQELELLSQAWRPWRTVATWYLWRSLDPVPVVY
ncbi:MAG: hypothetical protein A2Z96_02790 [Spirochaetes bacterium GWB1_48_6]|nr:MAG: hypothetical protein A2Z96_02790 [Spirochaetes bacterium GWB1_48_6]